MDKQIEAQNCPICGSDIQNQKKNPLLYGKTVCKKCYNGFGRRRSVAFLADFAIWLVGVSIIDAVAVLPANEVKGLMVLLFPVFCFKDGLSGCSVGKAMMGLQVINTTSGKPIGWIASFMRNVPLIIPIIPPIIFFQFTQGKRLGDGWSKSRVIWKKYRDKVPFVVDHV
jgi:uncharacterized RDD family membrane protein YckC